MIETDFTGLTKFNFDDIHIIEPGIMEYKDRYYDFVFSHEYDNGDTYVVLDDRKPVAYFCVEEPL